MTNVTAEIYPVLRAHYNFRDVPDAVMTELAGLMTLRVCEAEEIIFWEGDPSDAVQVIIAGKVDLHSYRSNDSIKCWTVLTAGDLLPVSELYHESGRHTMNARCCSRVRMGVLSRDAYFSRALMMPGVAAAFLDYTAFIINDMSDEIMTVDARERILLYLWRQFRYRKRFYAEGEHIAIPRDHLHASMGEMMNLTRETVNRTLSRMRRDGEISFTDTHIIVHDPLLLRGRFSAKHD